MGNIYKQLDQEIRDRISALKVAGHTNRQVGMVLGFHHTTIGREIKRNSFGSDGRTIAGKRAAYSSSTAQHKAYVRRKYAKYQGKKIHENSRLESFIVTNVKLDWNPAEMSGYMGQHRSRLGFYASTTTIYEWFDSVYGQSYLKYLHTRRHGVKKRPQKKTDRVMIPDRVSITERPLAALDRLETGHMEYDSIVSSKRSGSTHALAVVQERSTRLVRAKLVPNLRAEPYARTIVELTSGLQVVTMTTDNGIENRQHRFITSSLPGSPQIYFTDPYSSWQKGGIENANRMIRYYFPKGTDFSRVTQSQVDNAVNRINKKPRRCLGYKSAIQCAKEKGVILNS
jgi:transposase, IS30 family